MKKKFIIICSILIVLIIFLLIITILLFNPHKNNHGNNNTNASITKKTFTVIFDSNGGSKVESIKVKCGNELLLPENPTKVGYTFVSWVDKNETPIYDKSLLSCEDITLRANWKKIEIKEEHNNSPQNSNNNTNSSNNNTNNSNANSSPPQPEKQKVYKCPDGYELVEGTKCETKVNVSKSCQTGYTINESKDLCYITVLKEEYCSLHSGFSIGNGQCAIQPLLPSAEGNKEKCINSGFQYGADGKCYFAVANIIYSCPKGYVEPQEGWENLPQASTTCISTSSTINTCPDGYTLKDNWCYNKIDASYE